MKSILNRIIDWLKRMHGARVDCSGCGCTIEMSPVMSGEYEPHYVYRENGGAANIFKKGARNIQKQYYCTNCVDASENAVTGDTAAYWTTRNLSGL